MSCPRCKGTCEVRIKVDGVRTTDICPRCRERAEIEYRAWEEGFLCPASCEIEGRKTP